MKDNYLADLFFDINCKELCCVKKKMFLIQYAVILLKHKKKNNLKHGSLQVRKSTVLYFFQTLIDDFFIDLKTRNS